MGPTFLSVQRGHSSGCQSSQGWGDGVPPPPWESRVHLEQEEGRGRGEAAGISWCPVSAEIMEDEARGPAFSWPSGAQQPTLHPLPKRHGPLPQGSAPGEMRQQGPENAPHPQVSVTEEEKARPGEGRGAPIPPPPT